VGWLSSRIDGGWREEKPVFIFHRYNVGIVIFRGTIVRLVAIEQLCTVRLNTRLGIAWMKQQ
jgi:hypothetical protein